MVVYIGDLPIHKLGVLPSELCDVSLVMTRMHKFICDAISLIWSGQSSLELLWHRRITGIILDLFVETKFWNCCIFPSLRKMWEVILPLGLDLR